MFRSDPIMLSRTYLIGQFENITYTRGMHADGHSTRWLVSFTCCAYGTIEVWYEVNARNSYLASMTCQRKPQKLICLEYILTA
jgi:hypothetical protein